MFDYLNKEKNLQILNNYTLLKTLNMFEYADLPSTLKAIHIEKTLQTKGYAYITNIKDSLYCLSGALTGNINHLGEYTQIIVNNEPLGINRTFNIADGVLIQNDDLMIGVEPLLNRYNSLLVENEITMYLTTFNNRIQTLISASDDSTKVSAEKFLEKIKDGELGIIGENIMFEGVKTHTTKTNGSTSITELIEFNQYIKSNLLNELGIDSNFNMKRERLNTSEVEMNEDILLMLPDNMKRNRIIGINKLNEKYNLNIKVNFSDVWGGC